MARFLFGAALGASMASSLSPQALMRGEVKPSRISFEDVARLPRVGSDGLGSAAFSPDGAWLTYLGSSTGGALGAKELYAYEVESGEVVVAFGVGGTGGGDSYSLEEQLRRERARIMSTGVTSYQWAKRGDMLLVPQEGSLFCQRGPRGDRFLLFDPAAHADVGSGPCLDPKLCDDGSGACFVWDDEVCFCKVGGAPIRLTEGARGVAGLTNGVADYCAMEEMDRYDGFWLSPEGERVCYEAVDERGVPEFEIRHQGAVDPMTRETHRYPFAGAENPKVRLGVAATDGASGTTWLDLEKAAGLGDDFYLARVAWGSDSTLLAVAQSRDQKDLVLVSFDVDAGTSEVLLEEHNEFWHNLNDMLRWEPVAKGEFLFGSERGDGIRRLYAHACESGAELRCVTPGNVVVEELVAVGDTVYFLGNDLDDAPLERHLYEAPYDGSAPPRRVTDLGSYVDAAAVRPGEAPGGAALFVQKSSATTPTVAEISVDGKTETLLDAAADDARVSALELEPPSFFSIETDDGVALHGALYKPDGEGPWPTVVSCYGGPHVQFVQNKWATMTADLRAQHLRSQGFLVIKCDNRGSDRRGLHFEAPVHGRLGDLEVDDQVAAVEYAVQQGYADPANVGIYGWSYGGYLSAMCLAKAPKVFKAAVAGAPVSNWRDYDTHYTERYMAGGPDQNPQGYDTSSVLNHVQNVQGALLMVHGLIDENVHFRHTARLAQAMIDHGKAYDLLCFPNERHSPRSVKDKTFMEERVFAFLHKWLA